MSFTLRGVAGTLLGLGVLACTPSSIKPHYSRASNCPEDSIKVESLQETIPDLGRYRAKGCGGTAEYVCRANQSECRAIFSVVAARHAQQFGCEQGGVQTKDLGGGSWQAIGCNQTVTYQCGADSETIVRCIAETTQRGGGDILR